MIGNLVWYNIYFPLECSKIHCNNFIGARKNVKVIWVGAVIMMLTIKKKKVFQIQAVP